MDAWTQRLNPDPSGCFWSPENSGYRPPGTTYRITFPSTVDHRERNPQNVTARPELVRKICGETGR